MMSIILPQLQQRTLFYRHRTGPGKEAEMRMVCAISFRASWMQYMYTNASIEGPGYTT
jgi:hypothetical protein